MQFNFLFEVGEGKLVINRGEPVLTVLMHLNAVFETNRRQHTGLLMATQRINKDLFNPNVHVSHHDGFNLQATIINTFEYSGRVLYDDVGYVFDFDHNVYPGMEGFGWLVLTDAAENHNVLAREWSAAISEGFAWTSTQFINRAYAHRKPLRDCLKYPAEMMKTPFFKALAGTYKKSNYIAWAMSTISKEK